MSSLEAIWSNVMRTDVYWPQSESIPRSDNWLPVQIVSHVYPRQVASRHWFWVWFGHVAEGPQRDLLSAFGTYWHLPTHPRACHFIHRTLGIPGQTKNENVSDCGKDDDGFKSLTPNHNTTGLWERWGALIDSQMEYTHSCLCLIWFVCHSLISLIIN